jgi:cytochrome b561
MADRDAFDVATRVVAGDDRTNYDNVAITLHWLTAMLVLFQFVSSFVWDDLPRDTREVLEQTHVSLGVLLTVVIFARVIWRLMPGHQRPSIVSGWVEIASKVVHYLLYALLIGQAVLGLIIGWAAGHPLHFFGIPIPGPLDAMPRPTRHGFREIHEKVGYVIIILALGHALAAFYHHYKLHDRVLARMLPLVR